MSKLFYTTFVFLLLTFFGCDQAIDLSPCEDAFKYNRTVDPSSAKIPYMKTCGLSISTAKLLDDAYTQEVSIPQAYIDTIYDELEITDQILEKNQIPYSLEGGSLLGSIRNGGLIPNDDDADIMVDVQYDKKIEKLSSDFDNAGYKLEVFPFLGYKVKKKNTNSNGLDIFIVKQSSENGKKVWVYDREGSAKNWPNAVWPETVFSHLAKVPFGHLRLSSMRIEDAVVYLDRLFGKNWYNITYKIADHVNNRKTSSKRMKLQATEYYYLTHSKAQKK